MRMRLRRESRVGGDRVEIRREYDLPRIRYGQRRVEDHRHEVEFTPENAVQDDNNQWYICFDTAELGPGEVDIIFEAFVPDEDFESGVRREVQKYRLVNIKSV